MGLISNIKARFLPSTPEPQEPQKNSLSGMYAPLLEQFGYGRKQRLVNQTSEVSIQKEEFYRGLGYGVIRKAVNTGIIAAEENIRTTCSSTQRELLAQKGDQIEHPYITLYRNSPFFSEYDFWKWYLLYIQLKGEFYIYVDRKPIKGNDRYKAKNLMTFPKYMKLLNPYHITPNYDGDGKLISYTETKTTNGETVARDLPAYQVIRVHEINPFDTEDAYSLLDATQENFFTIKNAQDFTRHAVVNNTNSPMMISTGEFESEEAFNNFLARVLYHEDGEPIVTSGSGEVKVQELNQNLDGASLEKINGMNRDEVLVATGASKSILGIETTGLTRDVAATQKLTYVESTVVPMIKLMLETLNFDYRVNYPLSFAVDKYIMHITNPSTGDKAQELKELEVRETEYTMVEKYVARGFTRKSAAQYVRGEIDVEQLQLEDDNTRMTAEESTATVLAVQQWQSLIAAGNNAQDVVDLVEGRITLGEFLERNKDVKPVSLDTPDSTSDDTTAESDEGTYYDPDDDYSTPRDEKTPKAEKTKKEKAKNATPLEKALNILSSYDCKITKAHVTPLIDPTLNEADSKNLVETILASVKSVYDSAKRVRKLELLNQFDKKFGVKASSIRELQEKAKLSEAQVADLRAEINRLDYAIINQKLGK